jgi:hypothetical protein
MGKGYAKAKRCLPLQVNYCIMSYIATTTWVWLQQQDSLYIQ